MNFNKSAVMFTLASIVACTASAQLKTEKIVLKKSNTLVMNKEFTSDVTAQIAVQAKKLDDSLPAGEPIYLVLNTPGGSIFAGLELIENLNMLKRPVNTITIFAASMGFQTVQQLRGTRYIVDRGTLMSHKAKGGVEGEFPGQLDSRYRYILSVVTEMDQKDANRSKKHTLASYQALVENEYWCNPADCAAQGFVDAKAAVSCDSSLSETHEEVVDELSLMGFKLQLIAKFADCPTITAPLSLRVRVDGEEEEKAFKKLTRDQKEAITHIKYKTFNELTSKYKSVEPLNIKNLLTHATK